MDTQTAAILRFQEHPREANRTGAQREEETQELGSPAVGSERGPHEHEMRGQLRPDRQRVREANPQTAEWKSRIEARDRKVQRRFIWQAQFAGEGMPSIAGVERDEQG